MVERAGSISTAAVTNFSAARLAGNGKA